MRRVLLPCAIALARCGDGDPPGLPGMDQLSRETLERWHAKEYHLGRAGVKRARCALEVTLPRTPDAPEAARRTSGALLWDGERARTRWEDEDLGHEADFGDLETKDWCASWFGPWWKWPCFREAKLRGRRSDRGGVVIEFTDLGDEPCAFSFDPEGVLTESEWGTGDRRRTQRYVYERRDGKCLFKSCETFSSGGIRTCTGEMQYESVAGYLVPTSLRISVGGKPTEEVSELRFTGWKLDDDAR